MMYTCEYCKKILKTEIGFKKHKCKYLIRKEYYFDYTIEVWKQICKGLRIKISTNPEKQMWSFLKFPLWDDMIMFIAYVEDIKCIDTEGFIDFLIKERIKLKYWRNDTYYRTFLRIYLRKEPIATAVLRSEQYILSIDEVTTLTANRIFMGLYYGHISLKYFEHTNYDLEQILEPDEVETIREMYR